MFLNPPQPVKPQRLKASTAGSDSKQKKTTVKLPKTTPKFVLLATSYYRAKPTESLALVSEPGSRPRWVEPGARLGHFVVEKIEKGKITYKDGDRLGHMAVNSEVPIRIEPTDQTTVASDEPAPAPQKPPTKNKAGNTRKRRPMQKLGPPRPEKKVVAFDHRTTG